MAKKNWQRNIPFVQSSEPVTAAVTGRPDRAVAARTEYLRERLDDAAAGEGLLHYCVSVSADVVAGHAVYWNAATQQYERALAAVETDPASGALVIKASADCAGICHTKHNATLADVATLGVFTDLNIAAAVGTVDLDDNGQPLPGRYYLSGVAPGQLCRQQPPVSVPVLRVYGGDVVMVAPALHDFLEEHLHFRFSLHCVPAGHTQPPLLGERHAITQPEPDQPGWLPASHPSFKGQAPVGACFGYNLATHPELSRIWPPVPLEAVAVLWDKGQNHVGATEIPQGFDGLVICDLNGIWWMSDCYGDVPWPETYLNTSSESSFSSAGSNPSLSSTAECPREEQMRLEVCFIRMLFANDKSVVTALAPATGSPLTVTNCDGKAASTGNLFLGLNLALLVDNQEYFGGLVLKEILQGLKFGAGWVTEGLAAGSERVLLSSTHQRYMTPGDSTTPVVYQGLVTVDVQTDPTERELPPQIVKLGDVKERLHLNIPYLGLIAGITSGIRMRLNVPAAGLPTNPQLLVRVLLFGRAAGTLGPLTMSYYRLGRPTGTSVPTALTSGDTALGFVSTVAVAVDSAVEVESAQFDVAPGDTVLISITRGSSDGYAGEMGIIRASAILVGGD